MNKQIAKFNEASLALRKAAHGLDIVVQREMKKRRTVPRLLELIDILPSDYKGKRKIWERIEQKTQTRHIVSYEQTTIPSP